MSIVAILLYQKALLLRHKLGVYTTGYVTMSAIGSLMFVFLESDAFVKMQLDVLDAKERVLKMNTNSTAQALDAFIEELRGIGFRGLPNKDGTVNEMTFSDSFFFVSTLLTTVGYGNYAPRTVAGKVVCVIYIAIGIPIMLMFLAGYVDILLKQSERLKAFLFRKWQHIFAPFTVRLIHISSLMVGIVMTCFIIPAFIFTRIEKGWTWIDGIYFCFISLTTVGLGDMVPGLNPEGPRSDIYKICVSLYLVLGVMLIMFMMAICGDFQKNYKNPYEVLPYTVATEKVPINPGNVNTYGSAITESGKSETESEKNQRN